MPKNGISNEHIAHVEDRIAAIIAGRYALIDIEAIVIGAMRRSALPQYEQEDMLQMLSEVRRAIDLGHEFGKKVRGKL